jgi:methyltransferase (TIGR00027 family)
MTPYARHFVENPLLRAVLSNACASDIALRAIDLAWDGLHAHVALRVRYRDDARGAALSAGIRQIVLLGAGFDTSSLRHAADPVTVYEVDAPATQADKRPITEDWSRSGSSRRTVWVGCDFEHDCVRDRLVASGFDRSKASLVIWLGVTPYLTETAIDTTLADLTDLCAPGSQLLVDYIVSGVASGKTRWKSANRVTRTVARRGERYRSDFTPAQFDAVLSAYGFASKEHLTVSALLQRYDPHNTSRLRGDDWLAVATAERIASEPK